MPLITRPLNAPDETALIGRNKLAAQTTLTASRAFNWYFSSMHKEPELERIDIIDVNAQRALSLTAETLRSSTQNILSAVANFFIIDEDAYAGDEVILRLSEYCSVNICRHGNHIRVTTGDNDIAYWVCDEFAEAPGEVLGALCGLIYHRAERKWC